MLNCYFKKGILGLILFLFSVNVVNAQRTKSKTQGGKHPVHTSGAKATKVVDEYGKALIGVAIATIDGQTLGTTNEKGMVEIPENVAGQKVVFTAHNYYPKMVVVDNQLVVKMDQRYLIEFEEVNTLYGKKSAKESLGAVSSVYTNQLTTTPTSLYLNALIGRMAGFYTQEKSGFRTAKISPVTKGDLAGSLPEASARNMSSISDNTEIDFNLRGQNPVTIIDGVQRDIYSIDPESIESITIMKDALSTILLGQKSSRGVLQVTTKKGVAGAPRISFTAQAGFQNALKTPKPLSADQYAYLYNEASLNSDRPLVYSASDFNAFRSGASPFLFPNVNWYNELLKENSPISKYNLNVNGGLKNARYSLSLSYLNQEGMFQSSDAFNYDTNLQLNRYLINSSIDVDVTKDFSIGLQLFGRIQDGRQPGAGTANILEKLYTTPNGSYPKFNGDGSYGGSSDYTNNLYQQTTGSGYLMDDTRDLMANIDLKYKFDKILPGLYAKAKVNVSSTSSSLVDRNKKQPVYDLSLSEAGDTIYTRYGTIADQPNAFNATSTAQFFYVQTAIGYDTQVNDHQIGGMLFADQQTTTYQFDLPGKYTNIAATANYNYKRKYFAEAALNYSGFGRFRPGNQFGLFYAGGLGWEIAEESFIKDNVEWINQLKLRATYGRTGNTNEGALGYFSWRAAFGQDGINSYPSGGGYTPVFGLVELGLANVASTWEKGNKFNIGLDMTLFKRLKLTADVYRDVYFDLLQERGSSIEMIGMKYPNENIGKNLYAGQELSLTYQNNINNFNYFITANGSRMKTEVLYANELKQAYSWNNRTGMPVGQTFGYLADGLIQTQEEADLAPMLGGTKVYPGDVKLVDLNKDGVIDQFDQTALGNTKPIIFYGLNLGFNVKGFDFSVLLQGVKNRTYQQTDYSFGENGKDQGFDYMLGRWTPETATTATYPRLTIGRNNNNTPFLNNSSFWTHSGEYLRIKNIDLGYTIPYSVVSRLKVAGLRVFANAQNLFTETSYKRLDPEVYGNTAYPIQRIINLGVNVKL